MQSRPDRQDRHAGDRRYAQPSRILRRSRQQGNGRQLHARASARPPAIALRTRGTRSPTVSAATRRTSSMRATATIPKRSSICGTNRNRIRSPAPATSPSAAAWPGRAPATRAARRSIRSSVPGWRRNAVRELAAQKVTLVKLWVEDRWGFKDPQEQGPGLFHARRYHGGNRGSAPSRPADDRAHQEREGLERIDSCRRRCDHAHG